MGQNIESFNPRFNHKVATHPDNKDMLYAECERMADLHLRMLINTKKQDNDSDSEHSLIDELPEENIDNHDQEMSEQNSDESSDSGSDVSDRTFFQFKRKDLIEEIYPKL